MGLFREIKEKFSKNIIFQNKFQILFFVGFFLVIFALLRIFHWDHQEIKLIFGFGLIMLLLGIDSHLKSKITLVGFLGCLMACGGLFIFYFYEHRISDEVAFLYSIGLVTIITNIFRINFFQRYHKDIENFSDDLKVNIRSSIKPEFIGCSTEMTDLAIDLWRLEKKLSNISKDFQEDQQQSLENAIQRLKRFLKKHDIEIIDYTNKKFNEGLNMDILSIERDPLIQESIIKETIEPAIICNGKIIKRAKVIVIQK